MIDRRAVIAGGGGLLAAATTAFGQTPLPKGRIGYLHPHSLSAATYVHMEPVWRKLGYVDGETVLLRYAAGDLNRIPVLIDELIAAGADVLILVGPQAVRAAHVAKISVPIVAVDLESDPLREGFAQSFGRPRGNITGLFMDFPDLAAKWLQLLKEFAPAINRVILLWDPATGRSQIDALRHAASVYQLDPVLVEVSHPNQAGPTLRNLKPPSTTGVVQLGTPASAFPDAPLAEALIELKLPSIFHLKRYVKAGGLMSYGPKIEVYFPRAVDIAARILAGAIPGDLPIEKPDRFDFVVNARTAKALGLAIPPSILIRADEVLE